MLSLTEIRFRCTMHIDKGLISFNDEGKLMVSAKLSEEDYKKLALKAELRLSKELNQNQKKYLKVHLEQIFRHPERKIR
jgi:hypothetical protein